MFQTQCFTQFFPPFRKRYLACMLAVSHMNIRYSFFCRNTFLKYIHFYINDWSTSTIATRPFCVFYYQSYKFQSVFSIHYSILVHLSKARFYLFVFLKSVHLIIIFIKRTTSHSFQSRITSEAIRVRKCDYIKRRKTRLLAR